ncbi:MAG: MGMT family protein [Candidatus Thorarchaeota archaeon]|jgi:methylated-DNA-[protein]-cysteine S-methyltransferase
MKEQVYELTKRIPAGKVSTYGAIARACERPKAARAVGMILHFNPSPITIPCHRVVLSDGKIGGYGGVGGVKMKIELLKTEGVDVLDGKIRRFHGLLFETF